MKIYKRRIDGKDPDEIIETNFFLTLETADGTRFDLRENHNEPGITVSADGQVAIKPEAANKFTFSVAERKLSDSIKIRVTKQENLK